MKPQNFRSLSFIQLIQFDTLQTSAWSYAENEGLELWLYKHEISSVHSSVYDLLFPLNVGNVPRSREQKVTQSVW